MAMLSQPRTGEVLQVLNRPIGFSFWPTYKGERRPGLNSHVYSTNPWALIQVAVRKQCPAIAKEEALASLTQAEFFFHSAVEARETAAKPLPLYYSFLNLAKAFALTRGIRATFDQAQHGVSAQLAPGGKELVDAYLDAYQSPGYGGVPNIFADFGLALGMSALATKRQFPLKYLLPQLIPGHRIWCDAAGADERFVALDSIPFGHATSPKQIWATICLSEDDLSRLAKTRKALLSETRLKGLFKEVQGFTDTQSSRSVVRLEQLVPHSYTGRPSDRLLAVVEALRPYIWSTATTVRPFRRYYLYAAPSAEHASILPQALSIYAVAYYLGSITRYRPQHFSRIISGDFGTFIQEFLSSQPTQFLYLMASDFAKRDVVRAPLA